MMGRIALTPLYFVQDSQVRRNDAWNRPFPPVVNDKRTGQHSPDIQPFTNLTYAMPYNGYSAPGFGSVFVPTLHMLTQPLVVQAGTAAANDRMSDQTLRRWLIAHNIVKATKQSNSGGGV